MMYAVGCQLCSHETAGGCCCLVCIHSKHLLCRRSNEVNNFSNHTQNLLIMEMWIGEKTKKKKRYMMVMMMMVMITSHISDAYCFASCRLRSALFVHMMWCQARERRSRLTQNLSVLETNKIPD